MRIYHTTSILDNNHSLHELCAHFGIVPLIYAVTSQWGRCSLQRSIAPLSILSISSSLITILWSSSVIPLLSHQWPDEHQHYQDSNPKKTWKKSCATILVITISKLPLFSMEYSQTFWGGDADFHSTKKKPKLPSSAQVSAAGNRRVCPPVPVEWRSSPRAHGLRSRASPREAFVMRSIESLFVLVGSFFY